MAFQVDLSSRKHGDGCSMSTLVLRLQQEKTRRLALIAHRRTMKVSISKSVPMHSIPPWDQLTCSSTTNSICSFHARRVGCPYQRKSHDKNWNKNENSRGSKHVLSIDLRYFMKPTLSRTAPTGYQSEELPQPPSFSSVVAHLTPVSFTGMTFLFLLFFGSLFPSVSAHGQGKGKGNKVRKEARA